MKTKFISRENYNKVHQECLRYYFDETDDVFGEKYCDELSKCNTFDELIETSVFHDAIGKVVAIKEDGVEVVEEY